MKLETAQYLSHAKRLLAERSKILEIGLYDAAGRSAYMAGFHAAQGFIFETIGKVVKTHSGVHSEFARLAQDIPDIELGERRFLPRSYKLKSTADYEVGPDAHVSLDEARDALAGAERFVARLSAILQGLPDRGKQT